MLAETQIGFIPEWFNGRNIWTFVFVVTVLAFLLRALSRRQPKVRDVETSGRVRGVVGRMGSGKSYFAVRMAMDQLAAGANVASNFTIDVDHIGGGGKWQLFRGLDDFVELQGEYVDRDGNPCDERTKGRKVSRRMVVIIDEVHNYMPSSEHAKLPAKVRSKLSQCRKYGLDVYWLTQHESKCAKVLRDLTNEMYVCRSYGHGKRFTATCYEPETVREKGKELFLIKYKFDPAIAECYDTLELFDIDDHLVDERGRRGRRVLEPVRPERRPAAPGGRQQASEGSEDDEMEPPAFGAWR